MRFEIDWESFMWFKGFGKYNEFLKLFINYIVRVKLIYFLNSVYF